MTNEELLAKLAEAERENLARRQSFWQGAIESQSAL